MQDYIVFPKKKRMVVLMLLGLMFTLLGIILIGVSFSEASTDDTALLLIIGIICSVFFGLCVVYYIYVLAKNKPAVIVTQAGIIDQSSFIEAGLVAWEDIADIQIYRYSSQVYLGIFTHNPNLIIHRTSGIKKALNSLNKGLIDAQVNIPVKNLDCDITELMEMIESRWEQSVS